MNREANLESEIELNSIDVVIDLVAGDRWQSMLNVLKNGGRYITSGAIAGPFVELDMRTLYLKDLTLMGVTYQDKICFENLIKYIEGGRIRPLVAKSFPLKKIKEAQKMFLKNNLWEKLFLKYPDLFNAESLKEFFDKSTIDCQIWQKI